MEYCENCEKQIDLDLDAEHFETPMQCCPMCNGTGKVDFIEADNHIETKCECTLEN